MNDYKNKRFVKEYALYLSARNEEKRNKFMHTVELNKRGFISHIEAVKHLTRIAESEV